MLSEGAIIAVDGSEGIVGSGVIAASAAFVGRVRGKFVSGRRLKIFCPFPLQRSRSSLEEFASSFRARLEEELSTELAAKFAPALILLDGVQRFSGMVKEGSMIASVTERSDGGEADWLEFVPLAGRMDEKIFSELKKVFERDVRVGLGYPTIITAAHNLCVIREGELDAIALRLGIVRRHRLKDWHKRITYRLHT